MTCNKNSSPQLRAASTIILVRENNKVLEVYLLKRGSKAGFMGGLYVFPGGVVDTDDSGSEAWASNIDIDPDQIIEKLGSRTLLKEDALSFGIAAIRETLEEAGVFIATCDDKTEEDFNSIALYRLNRDLPKSWFKAKIMEENWILSLSSLGRWSHWITPAQMKKRFDTRFFIAIMPEKQICKPDQIETNHGIWVEPQKALEQNLEEKIPLSPPTIVTLTELIKFKNLDNIRQEIQTRGWGNPLAPHLVSSPNGLVIIEPWDEMFDCLGDSTCEIDTSDFAQKVLAPGSRFSRIWCNNGMWKPIDV